MEFNVRVTVDFSPAAQEFIIALLGRTSGYVQAPVIKDPVQEPAKPVVKTPAKKAPAATPAPVLTTVKDAIAGDLDDLSDLMGTDTGEDDLDKLLGELDGEGSPPPAAPVAPVKPVVAKKAPAKTVAAPAAAPVQTEGESLYTADRVKEAARKLILAGKQNQVKEIVTKYGAMGLSTLDSMHYEAFMADLAAIK